MAKKPSKSQTNPLMTDAEREHRIRERAYHLWEADGKPHGRDIEFWERARELEVIEESTGAGQKPAPRGAPKVVVEEARIQENLGEFPDRFADQVEVQQTPKPKRKAAPRAKKSS